VATRADRVIGGVVAGSEKIEHEWFERERNGNYLTRVEGHVNNGPGYHLVAMSIQCQPKKQMPMTLQTRRNVILDVKKEATVRRSAISSSTKTPADPLDRDRLGRQGERGDGPSSRMSPRLRFQGGGEDSGRVRDRRRRFRDLRGTTNRPGTSNFAASKTDRSPSDATPRRATRYGTRQHRQERDQTVNRDDRGIFDRQHRCIAETSSPVHGN